MTQQEHYLTVAFVFVAGLIGGFMVAMHTGVSAHPHEPTAVVEDHAHTEDHGHEHEEVGHSH